MDQREEWNRAKWASRRGLLELDLLLAPFVTEAFLELNALLRQDYRELLYQDDQDLICLLYTSPSPRDGLLSRMPSSA